MTFIWPLMLASLLLIPILVVVYLALNLHRQKTVLALGPMGLVQNRSGRNIERRRHIPPLLSLVGLTFLLFGMARPEMEISLPRVEGTVILVFDVSGSMDADDLEPSRIEAAKTAAQNFVENQPPTIMLGVVAFSDGALVVQPPTNNRADILNAINRLTPQGGTSLSQGMFTALNAIAGEPISIDEADLEEGLDSVQTGYYPGNAIVLLTDGENTDSIDPVQVAEVIAQAGVQVYPIGLGSAEGTVLEREGFSVVTRLNESLLEEIASLTNGAYFQAESAETLAEIYDSIDLQFTISGEKMELTAIIAGISLLFFLTGGILSMLWFGRMP